MEKDFLLLSDQELSNVSGGIEFAMSTPGSTVVYPAGFLAHGLQNGQAVGILNGTSPQMQGTGPVSITITP